MKKIFVYGILQKDISAKNFGLTDEQYLGRATLYVYGRTSLTQINKSKREDDYVCGDIFEVSDELEESLYQFENKYGYEREVTKPQKISDGEHVECISYIIKIGEQLW